MAMPPPVPPGKRKEIYKYEAPWTVYSMNWSVRPDKRFRLALGSFVEEYNNKVIHCQTKLQLLSTYYGEHASNQSSSSFNLVSTDFILPVVVSHFQLLSYILKNFFINKDKIMLHPQM